MDILCGVIYCVLYLYTLKLNSDIVKKKYLGANFLVIKIFTVSNIFISILIFVRIVDVSMILFSVIFPYAIPLLCHINDFKGKIYLPLQKLNFSMLLKMSFLLLLQLLTYLAILFINL